MRLVMDSDCLIKLTKAGLKEPVCAAWSVTIPLVVRRETTEQAPGLPDASAIRNNLTAGRLTVATGSPEPPKGEDAVLGLFQAGGFDVVATDDARFIRRLRVLNVPYAVPAVLVVGLHAAGALSTVKAGAALAALRPYISADEYAVAKLMMDRGANR